MVASKPKSRTVHVLRGGQITIPIEFRRELGIAEGTLLQVTLAEDGVLTIRPTAVATQETDEDWLRGLYELFEPMRREIRESGISEEALDAMIDESVADARARRYAAFQRDETNPEQLAR
jgi:AbrB family looped-hinge helix DNA binding protein